MTRLFEGRLRVRTWLLFLMGGTALLLSTTFAPMTWAADAAPVTVGFSITQTGPFSAPGIFELHGYQLAAEQINSKGGLLGRPVKLVYYDDQANPSTGVQLYQKLLTSDRVDLLLGPYVNDIVIAVAPLINRAKMVMLAVGGANVEPYQGQYPFLLQGITQTPRYMMPVIDLAAEKGYKRMALLVQETQFPKELARGIKEQAHAKGIETVFEASYPPGTNDFTSLVMKAAAAHPDMIIGATYLVDAEGIVRAAKAQNVTAKMFAFSIGPVEPEFNSALGTAANDILGTTLWFPTLKTPGNADFVKAYQAKFSNSPDYHAAVAYSALMVLGEAVQRVGSLDQTKLRDALKNLSIQTVCGPFKLNENGLQTGYSSYVLQWQNGKQVLVWPKSTADTAPKLPHPGWN
ncbi:MAG: amino acid ABC transporter substrate-binding protein [Candidatus Korobacteraceae bacterium]|jgi:branched-chain amino acid transport system substrate-binding protein